MLTEDAAIKRFSAILVEVAESLMRVRRKSRLWHQRRDRPGESGKSEETWDSLLIRYPLMKASRLVTLDTKAAEAVFHALKIGIHGVLGESSLHAICSNACSCSTD